MRYIESYDTEDVTEDNEPKDLSYEASNETQKNSQYWSSLQTSFQLGNQECIAYTLLGEESETSMGLKQ